MKIGGGGGGRRLRGAKISRSPSELRTRPRRSGGGGRGNSGGGGTPPEINKLRKGQSSLGTLLRLPAGGSRRGKLRPFFRLLWSELAGKVVRLFETKKILSSSEE